MTAMGNAIRPTPVSRPSAPSAPSAPNARGVAAPSMSRRFLTDTPARMRFLRLIAMAGALVFGVGAGWGARQQLNAVHSVRANTRQLVLLGEIRTNLVQADSVVANGFLHDGLEPTLTRATYEKSLRTAATLMVTASRAEPGDVVPLQVINEGLARYSGLIESARLTNRLGKPVGSSYLNAASQLLRDAVLPQLTTLSDRHQVTVNRQYRTLSSRGVVVAFAVGFGVVVVAAVVVWLSRCTKRTINIWYAGSALVLLISGAFALSTIRGAQRDADGAYRSDYTASLSLLTARSNAFDAKSAESLTLIARGSGAPFEARFVDLMSNAARQSAIGNSAGLQNGSSQLEEYRRAHNAIRALDTRGDWDGAVAAATSTAADSASALFDAFAAENSVALDRHTASLDSTLRENGRSIGQSLWMLIVGALIAGLLSAIGMTARLREYA